jgi:hypothetical protein
VVRESFVNRGVAEPEYWIAHYDGAANIPVGAVAKQYLNTPGYDVSAVADYWPGIDVRTYPHNADSEDIMRFDAGEDVHESIIVIGKTQLWFATADLGDGVVAITSIDFYGATPPGSGGAGVGGAVRNAHIDPHRPGPFAVPSGAVMAQIRYTADHSFGVGLS